MRLNSADAAVLAAAVGAAHAHAKEAGIKPKPIRQPDNQPKVSRRQQKKAFKEKFGLTSGRQLRRAKKRMKREILAKMRGEQP